MNSGKPHYQEISGNLSSPARIMRLFASALFLLLCVGILAGVLFWRSLPDVSGLADPHASVVLSVRNWDGQEQPFILGPDNTDWVPINELPEELAWAVIVAEDANFYKHPGFDLLAIKEALIYDLEQKKLARGASTITQQLAKNLYLSRDKNIRRKLQEVVIAWKLEKHLGKERILELYLNLVELGPMVHGFEAGARRHLAKSARELNAAEAAFLAAILPGPRVAFNPEKRPQRVRERAASLLNFMLLRRVLAEDDYTVQLARLDRLNTGEENLESPAPLVSSEASCAEGHLRLQPEEQRPWQLPFS